LGPVRTILFDLDGTLVDTIELILASYRHAFTAVRGAPLPDELWLRGIGTPLMTQLRDLARDEAEVSDLLAAYRGFAVAEHDRLIRRFDGVEDLLDRLAVRGSRVGVVTSKRRIGVDRALRACGLTDRFEVMVCAEDTQAHKPDPTPLLLGLERMGATAEQSLYVGDTVHDLVAGKRAGMWTAAALWGPFDRPALAPGEPDLWLEAPLDLLDQLQLP
jgi:pyrophosphatase PpaX